jgi:hypothetical protein
MVRDHSDGLSGEYGQHAADKPKVNYFKVYEQAKQAYANGNKVEAFQGLKQVLETPIKDIGIMRSFEAIDKIVEFYKDSKAEIQDKNHSELRTAAYEVMKLADDMVSDVITGKTQGVKSDLGRQAHALWFGIKATDYNKNISWAEKMERNNDQSKGADPSFNGPG